MVQRVEGLEAKLEVRLPREGKVLQDGGVEIVDAVLPHPGHGLRKGANMIGELIVRIRVERGVESYSCCLARIDRDIAKICARVQDQIVREVNGRAIL